MSLKPVLVVIPQRTLRFLSASGIGSRRCPQTLVARRQGMTCVAEVTPSSGTTEVPVPSSVAATEVTYHASCGEEEEEEEEDGAMVDVTPSVVPSRATKHKAVEQRRKKKISEGIQQLLEVLKPPSLSGKLTRAEILENVVDRIKTLREENEQLKLKIDSLPQPGSETELYGKLCSQVMEFISLKSQLQQYIEWQQQEQGSHDQRTESCDSPRGHTTDDGSEVMSTPSTHNSQSTITSSSPSSTASFSITRSPSCVYSAAPGTSTPPTNHRTITSNYERSGRNESIVMASEVPPTNQETPPTSHTWPVTSILSQVSQHMTTNTTSNINCHGSSLRTDRVQSSLSTTAPNEDLSTVSRISIPARVQSSIPAVSTNSLSPTFCMTVATSNGDLLRGPFLSSERTSTVGQQLRSNQDVGATHLRSESVNVLALTRDQQPLYHHQQQPPRQHGHSRERHRDGYLNHASSPSVCYHPSPALQQHTPSIVQPWVESHQPRPRPLHHMTKTTPRTTAQYALHHHNRELRLDQHNTRSMYAERFVPYPSPSGRVNHHTIPTFSSGSWSHSNHMTFAGSSSTIGHMNIAPLGRSYASAVCDPHQHQQHLTPSLYSIPNNFDYSNHYSSSQGQLSPFCHTRSRNMMSHDSTATPPYPIQPPPHTGSNSSATVWRPYSERSRSGFCLADILSLPSETETSPLQLESTPPSGHRTMDSFLVNRLLDDI